MKTATIVFTIIGIIFNFLFVNWICGIIGIAIGIWMLIGLIDNKKSIAAGVCGIIFTGIIAGILYLCWDDNN